MRELISTCTRLLWTVAMAGNCSACGKPARKSTAGDTWWHTSELDFHLCHAEPLNVTRGFSPISGMYR